MAYVEKYSGNEKSFKETKKEYVPKKGIMKNRKQTELRNGEEVVL